MVQIWCRRVEIEVWQWHVCVCVSNLRFSDVSTWRRWKHFDACCCMMWHASSVLLLCRLVSFFCKKLQWWVSFPISAIVQMETYRNGISSASFVASLKCRIFSGTTLMQIDVKRTVKLVRVCVCVFVCLYVHLHVWCSTDQPTSASRQLISEVCQPAAEPAKPP